MATIHVYAQLHISANRCHPSTERKTLSIERFWRLACISLFDDWEDSRQIEQTLKTWLKVQGYRIEGGQLEVFPSGNALRLPLQRGFGWLDPEGKLLRSREEIRQDEALAAFLCDLESNQRNWIEAKNLIESQMKTAAAAAGGDVQAHRKAIDSEGFDGLWNGGQIPERIEEARRYLDKGLTEDGNRHAAVISIQHLLWFGDRSRGVPRLPGKSNDAKRRQLCLGCPGR